MPILAASQVIRNREQAIEINSVLRNTYILLAMMIGVCAGAAMVAIQLKIFLNFWVLLVGIVAFPFAIQATARSILGLFLSFGYAAFLGLIAAPFVSVVLSINAMLVVQALAITAATFVGLSMYTIVRRADFSWLGQFLTVSMFVILGLIVLRLFVDLSPIEMMLSGFMIIVASALILFQTSQIVLGGERNYIIAATTLLAALWMLFMHILSLLAMFSGRD